MLVNVITRHAPANYGSLLQAIATQKVINKLGYDCKIIDYIPRCETSTRVAITQLKSKKEWNNNPIMQLLYLLVREPENILMYRKFAAMRKKYLVMGPQCFDEDELKRIYQNAKEDVFLTGSDQVWGPISTGVYDPAYFLAFAPQDSRKLAFASSFGKTAFDEKTLTNYKKYLIGYEAISVRENTAVDLIRRMGIDAEQVLDPTLLLSKDEWLPYITPLKKPKEYVLVYQIHNNPKLDKYVAEFAQHANLPLIRVSPLLHQIRRSGKLIYLPDIGGFLDLIKNATYMVTDSFHGTAFAINFNIQFVEVLPNTGTGSRNQSILQLTGLDDRIAKDFKNYRYIDEMIDYYNINCRLYKERMKSYDVLKRMLNK